MILFNLMIGESSYTELQKSLEVRKGSLTHHLKVLMKAGLVKNFSKGKFSGPYESFYTITELGRDLIQGLNGAFQPVVSTMPAFPQTATTLQSADEIVRLLSLRQKSWGDIYPNDMPRLTFNKAQFATWQILSFLLKLQIEKDVDIMTVTADSGWTVGKDPRIAPLVNAV
jgi:DNA-binding transcriptional ArsR family regulator